MFHQIISDPFKGVKSWCRSCLVVILAGNEGYPVVGRFYENSLHLWPFISEITGYFYGMRNMNYKWGDLLVLMTSYN